MNKFGKINISESVIRFLWTGEKHLEMICREKEITYFLEMHPILRKQIDIGEPVN